MYEDQLREVIDGILPVPVSEWEPAARARLDSLTKPPGSLGRLEDLAARAACVQGSVTPDVRRKAIVVMAGDHGVTAQGVSPYPSEVTLQMVANFAAGGAAINQLASVSGAELVVVDVGVKGDLSDIHGVRAEKVAPGTADMTLGPAMERERCAEAVLVGVRIARELAEGGVKLIGTGEMGIGNSTAAAALTSAFTNAAPEECVGRGTGLDDAGLIHKAEVVRRALEVNPPDAADPLGTLAALGGYEIAGLAGVVLGAASSETCVVADGFIAGSAALAAVRIAPRAAEYVFPSHRSAEAGHGHVLEALGHDAILDLDMRLGEGTGAALAMCVIDAACRAMSGMATFGEAGVSDKEA